MEDTKISRKQLYISAILSSFSSLTFGLNLTILGCVEDVFTGKNITNKSYKVILTDTELASVKSIFSIGALLSGLISPYIGLKKKSCIIANNIFYVAGLLILLSARGYIPILLSRVLVGIGIGFTCAYVPFYLETISPISIRGFICGFHQLCIVLGVLLGQILSFYFNAPNTWRTGVLIVLVFVFLHTIFLFFIEDVKSYETHTRKSKSVIDLLNNRRARLSVVTAIVLHSAQQLSCINGVLFYSNELFEGEKLKRLYTTIIGITFVLSTIFSMFLVDKYGRKPLLLLSILVDIISLMFLSTVENILIPVVIFIMGFSFGLGPIVWFISSEIFPDEYKSPGASLAVSMNWILVYLVSRYFPVFYERYDKMCFSFYSFCLILSFMYVLRFFRETRGKMPAFQSFK